MQPPIIRVVCDSTATTRLASLRLSDRYRIDTVDSLAVWGAAATLATPTCVVIDVDDSSPEVDTQLCQRLCAIGAAVIVVYRGVDLRFVVRAMRAGAIDVLPSPTDDGTLIAAIEAAATRAITSHADARHAARAHDLLASCTQRERAVLTRVAGGLLNKQIAADLACTESTVKVHRSRAMRKLGARSPAQLIQLVESAGSHAGIAPG